MGLARRGQGARRRRCRDIGDDERHRDRLATNVTVFMKRGTYIDEFRKAGDIREEYTGGRAPASTLLQIDRLASPDYLVEIEGIAVLE